MTMTMTDDNDKDSDNDNDNDNDDDNSNDDNRQCPKWSFHTVGPFLLHADSDTSDACWLC